MLCGLRFFEQAEPRLTPIASHHSSRHSLFASPDFLNRPPSLKEIAWPVSLKPPALIVESSCLRVRVPANTRRVGIAAKSDA
jgi:hypothetical protein